MFNDRRCDLMAAKARDARSGWRALGLVVLATLLTLSTAYFLAEVQRDSYAAQGALESVVVARHEIRSNIRIHPSFFKIVKLPRDVVPRGVYRNLEALFPPDAPPRSLSSRLYANEPILSERISDPRLGVGVASRVNKMSRALLVEVGRTATKAQLIYPGARIDILTTVRRPEHKDQITKMIAQNVEVLGVNGVFDVVDFHRTLSKKKRLKRNDILTVSIPNHRELQEVAHASSTGKLNILLRHQRDQKTITTSGVTSTELTTDETDDAREERRGRTKKMRQRRRREFRRVSRPQADQVPARSKTTTTIEFK